MALGAVRRIAPRGKNRHEQRPAGGCQFIGPCCVEIDIMDGAGLAQIGDAINGGELGLRRCAGGDECLIGARFRIVAAEPDVDVLNASRRANSPKVSCSGRQLKEIMAQPSVAMR